MFGFEISNFSRKSAKVEFSCSRARKIRMDTLEIGTVRFGVFSADHIRRNAVCEITNTALSGYNSINDPRMGEGGDANSGTCITCQLANKYCPGHFGYIELPEPVLFPHNTFIKASVSWLKCFCMSCYKPLLSEESLEIKGLLKHKKSMRLTHIVECAKNMSSCPICKAMQPSIMADMKEAMIKLVYKAGNVVTEVPLSPHEIFKIFDDIPNSLVELYGFDPTLMHPRSLVLTVLPVLPPCARPMVMTETNVYDDDLSTKYIEIVKVKLRLTEEAHEDSTKRQKNMQSLKFHITTLFDNSKEQAKHPTNNKPIKSIKQRVSGKEGQVRGNIMGKRVDFSGRTVIGPEPTLRIGWVGIPEEMATNLTYPEVVTDFNKTWLMDIIYNGKAKAVVRDGKRLNLKYALWKLGTQLLYNDVIVRKVTGTDGKTHEIEFKYLDQPHVRLRPGDVLVRDGKTVPVIFPERKDFTLNVGDRVERHLIDGDWVLINRQPTLHKGSMISHRAKILQKRTIRFNLAECTSYNADFDGDEMNLHVPQSHETRAEMECLTSVHQNILTPQSGKPNMVIVQDSLLAAYKMSHPDVYMTKAQFFDVANCIITTSGDLMSTGDILSRIDTIRTILHSLGKESKAYTGRGIISLFLPPDFTYEHKNNAHLAEPSVKIYRGVLHEGVLTKANLGKNHYAIIQVLYKEYGAEAAATFIDNMQFTTNSWLTHHGFTIGIGDCLANCEDEVNMVVSKSFMEAKKIEETTRHEGIREARVNVALNNARDVGLKIARDSMSPNNGFLSTIKAGSKGDFLNITMITGLLGQQNLGGKRLPMQMSNKTRTLPHYPLDGTVGKSDGTREKMPKEMEYESRGYIRNSFIRGLSPLEFYLHCLPGREGITDTSMGTSRSGYIMRRIIKLFEDLILRHDGTVRNNEGHIYQFRYGEEGFDPAEMVQRDGDMLFCDVQHTIARLNTRYERNVQRTRAVKE